MFKNLSDLVIENIKFLDVTTNPGRIGAYNTVFESCYNLLINQVEVDGTCGFGMLFWKRCHHIKVTNSYIHDTYADGIHFQRGSYDIVIDNCKFERTQDDAIAIVSLDANENWGQCYDVIISNNFIDTTTVSGSGICLDGSKKITCINNVIKNTFLAGIRVNRIKDDITEHYNIPSEITIINNYIDNVGLGNRDEANIDGIDGNICGSTTIIRNTIKNCIGQGINISGALGIYNISNNDISYCVLAITLTSTSNQNYDNKFIVNFKNNIIHNTTKSGAIITAQNSTAIENNNVSVNIIENIFTNLNTENNTSGWGIYAPNTKNLQIIDNIFTGSQPNGDYYLNNSEYIFKDNKPNNNAMATQNVGSQTQRFRPNALATGKLGDIIWNLNPTNNILLWVCTTANTENSDAVYTPVYIAQN